jgi:Zinc knuckle
MRWTSENNGWPGQTPVPEKGGETLMLWMWMQSKSFSQKKKRKLCKEGKCFLCKKQGHLVKDCPKKK